MRYVSWDAFTDNQIKIKSSLSPFAKTSLMCFQVLTISNQHVQFELIKIVKARQDIDTFTTTSGYTQIIGQPSHIVNEKLSCIDLLFTTNSKLLSDVWVKQTIYDKCHHNIIYRSINLYMPFLHLAVGKFGMTKTQIRYIYSKQLH